MNDVSFLSSIFELVEKMAKNSASQTGQTSARKANTARSTIGSRTLTAQELLAHSAARMAKPDDPIFKAGFVIGERRSTPLSKNTRAKS
jgi:allantoicase